MHRTSTRSLPAAVAFWLTCLTGVAHAATSFPDYPLQTGVGSVPPNVLFILDDSGSMGSRFMPDSIATTQGVDVSRSSHLHNTIYYNPGTTYQPWTTATGALATGGDTIGAVWSSNTGLSGAMDLMAQSADLRTFYVPKPTATDPADGTQYYRYQIVSVAGVPTVVRSEYLPVVDGNIGLGGVGCESTLANDWRNCTVATPTGRTNADEVRNFAVWFSYASTRSKAAKSGASEAFAGLGENFRIGFDTIWNRGGAAAAVNGNSPAMEIPVAVDGGLFRNTNKATWFNRLFAAGASGRTPLHGALQRAGRYYERADASGPWGPQTGQDQLSCRQNYAILTTDGYWNQVDGFTAIGNVDNTPGSTIQSPDGTRSYSYAPARPYSDTYENTLADIAMRYWNADLRADLANNVPSSNANPAFWQHMATFGISIGLKGTLDPATAPALIEAGNQNWPDPWQGSPLNWNAESSRRIDDLLHASVNGRGRFVAASNPQAFKTALVESLAAIQRRRASGSNVASNGPVLNAGSRLFQATYTSGEWSGDLLGISIVGAVIANDPDWSMSAVAKTDPRPFSARGVFTWSMSGGLGATFPTVSQTAALARSTGPAQVTGLQNAAYIKGDRSLEKQNGGQLRDRTTPIGDIVNSSPFYAKDTNTIYVGANDGMMHAVNADNGQVLFSYVPAGLAFASLATVSDPDYQHRFFVDGGIDVATTTQAQGLNILAGSLGRGGRGVYGLNVSSPAAFTTSHVLWDKTGASADTDMGYVLGAPLVRKGSDGSTLVIVGNGIESNAATPSSSRAYLFVYRLSSTGSVLSTVKIPAGTETANGLSEPRAADTDGDGDVDYVYAGDLQGNVWKFDLTGNVSGWDNSQNIKRLFTAVGPSGARQPITGPVALAREPTTNRIFVTFGTGRYVSAGDLTSTSVQSVYSIIDSDTTITSRASLKERTIPYVGVDSLGRTARAWESYSPLPATAKGWFVDLANPTPGERVVTAPFIKARAMWFSSMIPKIGSGCDSGGSGFLNAIDAFTGTNPQLSGGSTYSFIDVNGDGVGNDRLGGASGGGEDRYLSSVDLGIGMPAQGTGVGNNVFACGSEAGCGKVQSTAGEDKKRLSWRELYKRD